MSLPYGKRINDSDNLLNNIKKNIQNLSKDKIYKLTSHEKYGNIFKNIYENKILIYENMNEPKLKKKLN